MKTASVKHVFGEDRFVGYSSFIKLTLSHRGSSRIARLHEEG